VESRRSAFSARSRRGIAACLALGAWLACVAEALFDAVRGPWQPLGLTGAILGAALVSSVVLGGGLAAAFSWLLGSLVGKHVEARSREADDRAQVAAAGWLALTQVPMLLLSLVALALTIRTEPDGGPGPWFHVQVARVLPVAALLGIVVPAAVAMAARVRIRSRRRWLERVGAGEVARWKIVEQAAVSPGLPRLVGAAAGDVRTLVRVHEPGQPFREGESQEAVALVASP
jgi:hypothetical protein